MVQLKDKPEYVDIDVDFKPLPKYGHLPEKTSEFIAAELAIEPPHNYFWSQPNFPGFRRAAGDPNAVMPPGGPDRYRDVVAESLQLPARDAHLLEVKVSMSPDVRPDATLVYRMHGGGHVIGRHEVDNTENIHAAVNPDIVAVGVDYRSPEFQFPNPVKDFYDGLLSCKKSSKTLGIDPEKVILAGSSAGVNLLHFPSACHPKFYPQDIYELGSYIQNAVNCVLSAVRVEAFIDAYNPHSEPDYRHSPLLADSLVNRQPALIQCVGVDILLDEAFAYAEAL
ncbi:alpha/beta-hydrolase [Hypoxylon sp. FL1150]|nr:alpha/beta-hydrolase [Hypoxylon sp. FL1150]